MWRKLQQERRQKFWNTFKVTPRYVQGGIYKTLIKIALITEVTAELLREKEHEAPVFRWSSWDKLLPRELYCSHKIGTLPKLTYDKGQIKV